MHDVTERLQLQQRLVASEAEVQDLFNNAPCGYHTLGADGTYSRINDTELAWLGRQREELVGKLTPLDVYTGDSQRKFLEAYAQFRRTGRLQNEVFEMVSTSGERRTVSVDASAVRDASGAIIASRTVLHDVTRLESVKRQLEQLTTEQHAMLDNELVGIAKLRGRSAIWLNKAMHRIFGYEDGEMIGKSSRTFYASDECYSEVGHKAYQVLKSGANYRAQVQMLRKDGQPIWIDMNGAPLSSGQGETIWLLTDITALKQNEARLDQLASIDSLTGVLRKGNLTTAWARRWRAPAAATPGWRYCTSIWTRSRTSMTRWATPPATRSSRPWPAASSRACAAPTAWCAPAATNSSSCSRRSARWPMPCRWLSRSLRRWGRP